MSFSLYSLCFRGWAVGCIYLCSEHSIFGRVSRAFPHLHPFVSGMIIVLMLSIDSLILIRSHMYVIRPGRQKRCGSIVAWNDGNINKYLLSSSLLSLHGWPDLEEWHARTMRGLSTSRGRSLLHLESGVLTLTRRTCQRPMYLKRNVWSRPAARATARSWFSGPKASLALFTSLRIG